MGGWVWVGVGGRGLWFVVGCWLLVGCWLRMNASNVRSFVCSFVRLFVCSFVRSSFVRLFVRALRLLVSVDRLIDRSIVRSLSFVRFRSFVRLGAFVLVV